MPNIMLAPLDFDRVEHGAGGGVGLAEVPGDTEGEGGRGSDRRRCPPPARHQRGQPHQHQRKEDHDRPPDPQAHQAGRGPQAGAHGAHVQVIGLRVAESPELKPTATPVLPAAAVTPAPGSPDSGGRVLAFESASKSTACGRSTPSPPRTSVVPTARPCTSPVPCVRRPLALPCGVGWRPTSHVTRLRITGGGHGTARPPTPCRRSRGRCPTRHPEPAAPSPCRLLSHATGVKWSLAWELPTATPLLLTP